MEKMGCGWIMLFIAGLLSFGVSAQANDESCPVIVETALAAIDSDCSALQRNTACYGNLSIQAEAQPGVTDLQFTTVGDIASLNDIQSLTLRGMDATSGTWGVALLHVQANIPDTMPGQNVTILLFGDVEISQADDSPSPMQSFIFRSGIGESACMGTPESGLLIQTPEGVAEVNLNINGVDMQIGSTAFIQAFPPDEDAEINGQMVVNLLEGEATITANDEDMVIAAGQFSVVVMDEDLQPVDTPSLPMPYDASQFEFLPISVLDKEIKIVADTTESFTPTDATPLSGAWLYATNELVFGDNCPAELVAYMPTIMPQITETIDIDWSGGFTVDSYVSQTEQMGEPLPAGAVTSNPEPGLIRVEFSEEGASVYIEMRVISETYLETSTTMTITEGMSCTIIIPGYMEFQGE